MVQGGPRPFIIPRLPPACRPAREMPTCRSGLAPATLRIERDRFATRTRIRTMSYTTTSVPAGDKITMQGTTLSVPDKPIIPFIRGDGTGRDIWKAGQAVFNAAVQKAYGENRKIAWMEVFA